MRIIALACCRVLPALRSCAEKTKDLMRKHEPTVETLRTQERSDTDQIAKTAEARLLSHMPSTAFYLVRHVISRVECPQVALTSAQEALMLLGLIKRRPTEAELEAERARELMERKAKEEAERRLKEEAERKAKEEEERKKYVSHITFFFWNFLLRLRSVTVSPRGELTGNAQARARCPRGREEEGRGGAQAPGGGAQEAVRAHAGYFLTTFGLG